MANQVRDLNNIMPGMLIYFYLRQKYVVFWCFKILNLNRGIAALKNSPTQEFLLYILCVSLSVF